jgi:uncharacterized protein YxeA
MYDPKRQYRCTIIRGKSKKEMDDLLPAYAKVIDEVCPCSVENFDSSFNNAFKRFLPESQRIKKTLDNHRTEIAGKLFGMYYESEDGIIYESQRTQKYLEDNDQPAFFKDVCYKMQFPNGMDSVQKLGDKIANKICIRPNAYVLRLLQIASTAHEPLNIKDIGYYVLNSLDVLQGKADPYEVLEEIVKDHKKGIQREIVAYDNKGQKKAASFTMQHIREQLNYLELANLIRINDDKVVSLNLRENRTIEVFANDFDKSPAFDIYSFDLSSVESRKEFYIEWIYYFSMLSDKAGEFETSVESLLPEPKEKDKSEKNTTTKINLTKFGDIGEELVYEYEKKRVAAYNPRLVNKVIPFGKTKGVGFDVQSIVAEEGDKAEFCKYIEVKSTKRFTSPDLNDNLWLDTLNITRNEWVAAMQHGEYYSIYRLYFSKDGVVMFMLNDIAKKKESNTISVTPMTYRLDFSSESVDDSVELVQHME